MILTTNLRLLCMGKRLFRRYWGVSIYFKILRRNAAPLSSSCDSSSIVGSEPSTELPLLSNTTTCARKKLTTHFSTQSCKIFHFWTTRNPVRDFVLYAYVQTYRHDVYILKALPILSTKSTHDQINNLPNMSTSSIRKMVEARAIWPANCPYKIEK